MSRLEKVLAKVRQAGLAEEADWLEAENRRLIDHVFHLEHKIGCHADRLDRESAELRDVPEDYQRQQDLERRAESIRNKVMAALGLQSVEIKRLIVARCVRMSSNSAWRLEIRTERSGKRETARLTGIPLFDRMSSVEQPVQKYRSFYYRLPHSSHWSDFVG